MLPSTLSAISKIGLEVVLQSHVWQVGCQVIPLVISWECLHEINKNGDLILDHQLMLSRLQLGYNELMSCSHIFVTWYILLFVLRSSFADSCKGPRYLSSFWSLFSLLENWNVKKNVDGSNSQRSGKIVGNVLGYKPTVLVSPRE